MRLGLCRLFAAMSGDGEYNGEYTDFTGAESGRQGELFGAHSTEEILFSAPDNADIAVILALDSSGPDLAVLPPHVRRLFELSINAFEAIVHAWMSELPITAEIIRFGQKILAAADMANNMAKDMAILPLESARRLAADTAASDRGDPDVRAVLKAAYKVWHETHRLLGLLRFCPDEDGEYIAHCEPDHFTLPGLASHFRERFGQTPWAIIDEKRRLCMRCSGKSLGFFCIDNNPALLKSPPDGEWENLWRHYHKTINNESRNNPDVQRRFMPQRYWKYLTELT